MPRRYEVDPQGPFYLADSDFSSLTYFGASLAETTALVTISNYSYPRGHAKRYGALVDGATDDTTAYNATLLQAYQPGGDDPIWPEGTAIISQLFITSPVCIRTAGYATILQQKSGLGVDKQMICVRSSDVIIEEFAALGNISTDTGEFNHCVIVGGTATISRIKLLGVKGTNVRGDVVYLGGTATFPLYNVNVGDVYGTNIYRNVMSFIGVNGCNVESIAGTQVGYRLFDVEPNAGTSQAPTGIRIKYCRGANVLFAGDPTINLGSVIVDYMELDNSLLAASSPAYPTGSTSAGNIGFIAGNFQSIRIGFLKARGYLERLVNSNANTIKGSLIFDGVDISGCNTTEAVFKTLFNIDEKVNLRVNSGDITLAAIDRYIVKGNSGPFGLNNLRISGGCIAATGTNCEFTGLQINATSVTGNLLAAVNASVFRNIVFTSDGSATLQVLCSDNTWMDSTMAPSALNTSGGSHVYLKCSINSIAYRLNGPEAVVAFNPGVIAAAGRVKTTVTVSGAIVGDYAEASFLGVPAGADDVTVLAKITAANTATVIFQNTGGAGVTFSNDTLRVATRKAT
jgi:hypothetical protein